MSALANLLRPAMRPLLFLLGFWTAPALWAAAGPGVSAEHSEVDWVTGEAILRGKARITYGDVLLTADEIRYHQRTQVAVARGRVVLVRGAQRVLAESAIYRFSDQAFSLQNVRLGEHPYYLAGRAIEGTPEGIQVEDALITFDEPGPFRPTVAAESLFYVPGERFRATRAQVGVGSVRPLRWPSFEQNLDGSLLSHLSVSGGYTGSLGALAELGLYLPVMTGVQAGGSLAFYTRRGFLFGPGGQYRLQQGNSLLEGSLRTGYIHDNGNRLTDVLQRPISTDRGFVAWQHRQQWGERLSLAGQVNYWSDSEVLRDFYPRYFYPVQTPDTYLEGAYAGDNYLLSLFLRAQPNSYHAMQQRLPEVRFELLPTRVGAIGLYQRGSASAAFLREDALFEGPTLKSERFDAYYALFHPFHHHNWLTVTPLAGGRVTHYARTLSDRSDYTRVLGELGLDAELVASGVYAYRNERWKIDGLRHLVIPRLSYRYIPEAARGQGHLPPIDRTVFSTYLQPLGLGDQRNVDELRKTHTLRLAVDNRLQTRDAGYGSRDLVQFQVAADVFLHRPPGERDVSAIHTELALTPAPWLRFDWYESFSPQTWTLREFNTGVTLHDGSVWSLRFANHYLDGQISEYIAQGRYRFNEVFEGFAQLHFDARLNRMVQQTYGVRQMLANLWQLQYSLSFYEGRRRESAFSLDFSIELARF